MKKLLFIAAATLTLASCSQNGEFEDAQKAKDLGDPISFGVYTGRSAIVKAAIGGTPGSLNTAKQLGHGKDYGFGVFAYYTKAADYTKDGFTPIYMYNEQVYSSDDGATWNYDLIKYWPNDITNGGSTAAPGTQNKISFFAYAPYTPDEVVSSGTGLTSLPENTEKDPIVGYRLASDRETVDLLWGTTDATGYADVTGGTNAPKTLTGGIGPVNVDIKKMKTGDKIKFLFKHALAKFGGSVSEEDPNDKKDKSKSGLQIVLDVDNIDASTGVFKKEDTKVTVKSITIVNNGDENLGEGDLDGSSHSVIYSTGKLNLTTGVFETNKGATDETTKINHSIVQEGQSGSATLNKSIAEPSSVSTWDNLKDVDGVLTTTKNVYENEENPLVFLPGTKPSFKITIEYIIRTHDTKLPNGQYSEAVQKITKNVALATAVESNKKYNLIIHLGLTSIKFEANVQEWETGKKQTGVDSDGNPIYGSDDVNEKVHLPINVN